MYTIWRCARVLRAQAIAIAVVICTWMAGALVQAEPVKEAAAADCEATLDGHVVDEVTHQPVGGASVWKDGTAVALTTEDGRFVLKNLCQGDHVIKVDRLDYELHEQTLAIQGSRSLEISLHADLSELVVIQGKAVKLAELQSVAVLSGEALERTRGKSFSEALAEVPGVTQLRSASGTAKPIVRGQFGRRLLMLVDSVQHRSQEWGLDHAPEVDPFVAEELKVVRGAAGVRYGPGAIGGAVIAVPPKLLESPGLAAETHLMAYLAQGAGLASRLQVAPKSIPGFAYQLQGTLKRLGAASTPDYALQNTGSLEWNLGGTVGYRLNRAEYTLSYRHYEAKLGVCACLQIESSEDFFAQLERKRPINSELYEAGLDIERPYQTVAHEQAVARARWPIDSLGTLTATYALQFDHRSEFAVTRTAVGPQFDFRLTTHDVDVVLEHKPIHLSNHWHLRGEYGAVGMVQSNSYRGLPLIPDYQAVSGGVFAIERLIGHDIELEAGLRLDALHRTADLVRSDFLRLVRSEQLALDACSDSDADPVRCESSFLTFSGSLGALVQLTKPWSLTLDLSTASRPPSPDEQYLNGTSPTFPVLGLGKPDLGSETTYSASATSIYRSERVAAEASAYVNHISDYIYFSPAIDASGEPIFDVLIRGSFPRFITRPVDAIFYGADAGGTLRLTPALEVGSQLSLVRAKNRTDSSFLVLVPSDRLRTTASYTHTSNSGLEKLFASVSGTLVARQSRFDATADLAAPPDGYYVLDAEVGAQTQVRDQTVKLSLQGSNLTDNRYRDYTSLMRYFADQPGLQLMLRLSVEVSAMNRQ